MSNPRSKSASATASLRDDDGFLHRLGTSRRYVVDEDRGIEVSYRERRRGSGE